MKCPEVMEFMQRYVDHDLDQAEEALLLAHVMQCPECADMLEKLQLLSDELESLPDVVPPFSIVDSILPQLERMMDEQSAAKTVEPDMGKFVTASEREALLGLTTPNAAEAEKAIRSDNGNVPARTNRTKRVEAPPKVRWFSWKWAGGAAAAAVIVGVFLFQQKPLSHQNADSLAAKSDKVRAMSTSGSANKPAAAQDAGGSTKSKEPASPEKADSNEAKTALPTESPQAPPASQKPVTAPTNEPSASAKPGASVKALSPSPNTTAKSVLPSPTPKPTAGSASPKPSSSLTGPTATTPSAGGSAGSGSKEQEAGAMDNSKMPSLVKPPVTTPGPDATGSSVAPDKQETTESGKLSLTSHPSPDGLESPNKTYKAVISGQHVKVLDAEGSVIAESPDWIDAKSLRLEAWSGTVLQYTVVMANGAEKLQEIDFGGRKIKP
ncbi:zf-HC2 domain-containing protein [Paenibacillus sp. MBLB4367]|uniref:zf-HC2 domain-containing protein n=1 Tax=Paenibacillus sp. MBLB4367 TaxID=3384767 RepID=UPI0039082FCC